MDIQLPKPQLKGSKSLEESIYKRKSIREFQNKEIEIEKISQLLWSAQGKASHYRTVPSAGATYPLEILIVLKDRGLYQYNIKKHVLELNQEGDFSKELAAASLHQNFIHEAPLNIIICAIFSRTCNRYGDRGIRYIFIEVGHAAQNIHLQAVALDLGSVPIGAFDDNEVRQLGSLD